MLNCWDSEWPFPRSISDLSLGVVNTNACQPISAACLLFLAQRIWSHHCPLPKSYQIRHSGSRSDLGKGPAKWNQPSHGKAGGPPILSPITFWVFDGLHWKAEIKTPNANVMLHEKLFKSMPWAMNIMNQWKFNMCSSISSNTSCFWFHCTKMISSAAPVCESSSSRTYNSAFWSKSTGQNVRRCLVRLVSGSLCCTQELKIWTKLMGSSDQSYLC